MPHTEMEFAIRFKLTEPLGLPTEPYEARMQEPEMEAMFLEQVVGIMMADAAARGRPAGPQFILEAELLPGVKHTHVP